MSSESLDLLRQQGFPIDHTDVGLVAHSVETHGCESHSEGQSPEPPMPYSLCDRVGRGKPDPE
eukprot:548888-Amphidinium_carterae.1